MGCGVYSLVFARNWSFNYIQVSFFLGKHDKKIYDDATKKRPI